MGPCCLAAAETGVGGEDAAQAAELDLVGMSAHCFPLVTDLVTARDCWRLC